MTRRSSSRLHLRAVIVTDEFGTYRETRFESLLDARRAWTALPCKHASVLFVLEPSGNWATIKAYGQPLVVSTIQQRQRNKVEHAENRTPRAEAVATEIMVAPRTVGARRSPVPGEGMLLVLEGPAVEVPARGLEALVRSLAAWDPLLNMDERVHSLTVRLAKGTESDTEAAGRELLERLAVNEYAAPRVAAWLEARRSYAHVFAKHNVVVADALDATALRDLVASGCAVATVTLLTREGVSAFQTQISLPAHGLTLKAKPARFAHYAVMYSSLREHDPEALDVLPRFPRRHLYSKLSRIGTGLAPTDLALRCEALETFIDELVDVFATLSRPGQNAFASWLADSVPPLETEPWHERDELQLESVRPHATNGEPPSRLPSDATTVDVTKDESDTRGADDTETLGAQVTKVAQQAYDMAAAGLTGEEPPEVDSDERVLLLQLRGINGVPELAAETRLYVSVRVLDEDDEEQDAFATNEARSPATVSRSDERTATVNPTWNPAFDFTIFLKAHDWSTKRILVGVHDASMAASRDDDTNSIFLYAVLDNIGRFATPLTSVSVMSRRAADPLTSLYRPLDVPLVDDENVSADATLDAEAVVLTSAQMHSYDILRRQCVLVYERRVFSSYVEALGVGWLMHMATEMTCSIDSFEDTPDSDNENSYAHAKKWKYCFACVPDDIQRPLAHVPDHEEYTQPASSFDLLSPLLPEEKVVKNWHMCHAFSEDAAGWR